MKPANIKLDHSSVIYLYSCPLSTDEISFISREHSALVTTTYMYQLAVSAMRLAEYFFDKNSNTPRANEHDTPFHTKSTLNPQRQKTRRQLLFRSCIDIKQTYIRDNFFLIDIVTKGMGLHSPLIFNIYSVIML